MGKMVGDEGLGDIVTGRQSLQTHLFRQQSPAGVAGSRILHVVRPIMDNGVASRQDGKRDIEFGRVSYRVERKVKSADEHRDLIFRRENSTRRERHPVVANPQSISGVKRAGSAADPIRKQQGGELRTGLARWGGYMTLDSRL